VEGGTLTKAGKIEIQMPQGAADSYTSQSLIIHFGR
jgi:ribosomal protein S30